MTVLLWRRWLEYATREKRDSAFTTNLQLGVTVKLTPKSCMIFFLDRKYEDTQGTNLKNIIKQQNNYMQLLSMNDHQQPINCYMNNYLKNLGTSQQGSSSTRRWSMLPKIHLAAAPPVFPHASELLSPTIPFNTLNTSPSQYFSATSPSIFCSTPSWVGWTPTSQVCMLCLANTIF